MRKPPSLISCATIRLRPQRFLTKTILQYNPVTPPNPLDDDYGGNDVDGRFQAALQSHDRVLKRMVHHPRLVVPYTVYHQVPTSRLKTHGKKVDKTLTVHVELGKTSLNFWSRS